jgi:hypothetical protein
MERLEEVSAENNTKRNRKTDGLASLQQFIESKERPPQEWFERNRTSLCFRHCCFTVYKMAKKDAAVEKKEFLVKYKRSLENLELLRKFSTRKLVFFFLFIIFNLINTPSKFEMKMNE